MNERMEQAFGLFDEANSRDPNRVSVEGEERPAELVYAERMSARLERFEPDASEALHLAARCQHIERWTIPRERYPMTRPGYLSWRNELKRYHASRAREILERVGYGEETVARVEKLVMKQGIKSDPEVQCLEDVICLVFLDYYFDEFAEKHDDEKLIGILSRTWRKMSDKGRKEALALDLSDRAAKLIAEATGQG